MELPKVYRQLLKVDYKHFISNLRRGECEIPERLQTQPSSTDASTQQLAAYAQQIADVRRPTTTTAPVGRLATQLAQARRILRGHERQPTAAASKQQTQQPQPHAQQPVTNTADSQQEADTQSRDQHQ